MIYSRLLRSLLILMLATTGLFAQNGGNALRFDGTDDFIRVVAGSGSGLDFSGSSTFTVSFWIYPENPVSATPQHLFHKQHNFTSTAQYALWIQNGMINARIDEFNDAGNYFLFGPTAVITQSKWYNITLIKSSNSLVIYVDGLIYATGIIPSDRLDALASTRDVYFGIHGDGVDPFIGKIDEIKIWNTIRSLNDIRRDIHVPGDNSTPSMVLYLPLDEGTGQSPADGGFAPANTVTLGNLASAEPNDPTWVVSGALAGPRNALRLDGVNEHGRATGAVLNSTDLTVEFWAKSAGGTTQRLVLGQGTVSTNNYLQVGFRADTHPTTPNGFFMGFFNNDLTATAGATDTEWQHYAATYNRTTGERKLYRNGVLVAQDVASGSLNSSGTIFLGSSIVNTEYFNGDLDEFRVWRSVRTQEEIVANMNRAVSPNSADLYVYYSFDNAPDASQATVPNLASTSLGLSLWSTEGASDFVASRAFHTWLGGVDNQTTNSSNWSTGLTPSNNDNVGFDVSTLLTIPANIMSTSVFRNVTFTAPGTTLQGSLGVLGSLGLSVPFNFGGNMVSVSLAGRLNETGTNIASNGDFLSSRNINAPNNDNIAGFGATLTSSANLGTTMVKRSHTANTIGAFTGIKRSYEFTPATNTGLDASLVFSYDDSELNGNSEGTLRLIKSTNNGTSWALVTATHNAVANTFSVTGQNSLGLYTAFAYSAPTINLTAPANAAITQSLTPTLTWSITGGVSPFTSTVVIATDPDFLNIIHVDGVGSGTTYNVPAGILENNTRYWWRIAVLDGVSGGTTSLYRTFTTLLATPALASPATEFESPVMSPDLSWTMDNRKSNVRYKLLVGAAPGLTALANTNVTSGNNPGTLTLNPTGLAVATKYWWTVQAEVNDGTADNNGEFKVAAPERTFYTPLDVLNKPYNGVTGLTLEPYFTWDDVLFETGYELRISAAGGSQAAFDGAVLYTDLNIPANTDSLAYNENTLNEGPGSQYPFPLTPNTTYYWQLVAKDGSVSIKSPIWHFTTYPAVTVSQHNPANGDSVFLNNLMFTYGINQATVGLKFKLQVKSGSVAPVKTDWLTSSFTGVSTNLFQTVNLLGGTKYWWRVVLLNDANEVMAYSATQWFSTSGGATVPYPSWPVGDPLVYTNSPMLHWYTAGYSSDVTFDVVLSGDTTAAGYSYTASNLTDIYHQISTNLTPGTRHFWAVRSVYKRGTPDEVISNFSFWQSFRTNGAGTLVVPNPSYPTDNLLVYTTAPYFYWWLGQDGTGLTYQFEYDDNIGFSSPVTVSNISDLFTQVSGLTPGVTYHWRVRSYNGSAYSGWSATASFTVAGGVANGYTVLNWPTGNPTVYTTMPTLSWYLEGSPMGITQYVVRWKVGSNSSNWNSDYTGSATVTGVYNTSYTFSVPFAEGQVIYWAVAASDGSTLSAWASDHFTIYSGATPGEPVISWPSGNALIYTVDPQLSWWVNGSTSGIVGYQVVYSYSDVFFPAATTTVTSTNTWVNVSNLVQGATYYWKVRAHFGGANYGAFSAVESFTVNPGSFNPVTPIVGGPHNVIITTTSPVLSWVLPAAPQAGIRYELEVADNQEFTNSMLFENLAVARQTLQGLAPNTSYFWRVRTKYLSESSYSFYSTMGRFRTADGATDIKETVELPKEFNLSQNWPNPFNPTTMIRFAVPTDMNVKLDVYNTLGEKVAELVNGPMTAGTYEVPFNASSLPSGIYFYRIEAGSNVAIKKMILMK